MPFETSISLFDGKVFIQFTISKLNFPLQEVRAHPRMVKSINRCAQFLLNIKLNH